MAGIDIKGSRGRGFTEDVGNSLSPGCLCSTEDPDFSEFRYPENIPYCARNVTTGKKNEIKNKYSIEPQDRPNFEIDHRLPLWLGGSNRDCNLMPIEKEKHLNKNEIENEIRLLIENGKITQELAVKKIQEWYHSCFFNNEC